MTVLVVGDANVDMVIRLPDASAAQPDLSGSKPQLFGGGSAANVAAALARLDVPTGFVGALGDDGYGRRVRDELAAEGVDVSGIHLLLDSFTAMVIAMVQPSGERWIVVWPPDRGADNDLRAEHIDADRVAAARWLHTSGMSLRASPVREAVLHAMQIAHEAGVPVSLDLNLRLELWGWQDDIRATITRALGFANVVFGSADEEIVPLTNLPGGDARAAAKSLAAGTRTIVARQGAAGAFAVSPAGETVHVPAFPVEMVDTIGAGDAFNGGFIAARLDGLDIAGALRWGNAAAALAIQQPGARSAPTRAALEALLAGE